MDRMSDQQSGLDLIGNISGTVFDSWMHGNLDGGGHIKTDLWSPHFAVGLAYRF